MNDHHLEWDPDKNRRNIEKHGYAFQDFRVGDDNDFLQLEGRTKDGELREMWITYLHDHLVSAVITRRGQTIRIISLRRASDEERRRYHGAFGS